MVFQASLDDDRRRLDRVLRKALPDMPLSRIHKMLRSQLVRVDGSPRPGDYRIAAGQTISLVASRPGDRRLVPASPLPGLETEMPPIIWEGCGLLLLNKAAGIAVHGNNSLETLVRRYLAGKREPSLSFKPGPLHRLDQGTSGIIAFGESLAGAQLFSDLMQKRLLQKTYLALLSGSFRGEALWDDMLYRDREKRKTETTGKDGLPGKRAISRVQALEILPEGTLEEITIETGLTHQIRAQAALHGHPLPGDIKYGGGSAPGGYHLHAWKLTFPAAAPGELAGRTFVAEPPITFPRAKSCDTLYSNIR
jgi:23S rRNA pseudouridine955/2504/2580 synthase